MEEDEKIKVEHLREKIGQALFCLDLLSSYLFRILCGTFVCAGILLFTGITDSDVFSMIGCMAEDAGIRDAVWKSFSALAIAVVTLPVVCESGSGKELIRNLLLYLLMALLWFGIGFHVTFIEMVFLFRFMMFLISRLWICAGRRRGFSEKTGENRMG